MINQDDKNRLQDCFYSCPIQIKVGVYEHKGVARPIVVGLIRKDERVTQDMIDLAMQFQAVIEPVLLAYTAKNNSSAIMKKIDVKPRNLDSEGEENPPT